MASLDVRSARRVLRNRRSREYLGEGGWTRDVSRAKEFQSIREAVETCLERELSEIDLVLRFDGVAAEITVRVR